MKDGQPRGHHACALHWTSHLHCCSHTWALTTASFHQFLHIFVCFPPCLSSPHIASWPREGTSMFPDLHYLRDGLISLHSLMKNPHHITSAWESYKSLLCFKVKHSGYHLTPCFTTHLSLRSTQYPCVQISGGTMLSWLFNGENHWGNASSLCQGAVVSTVHSWSHRLRAFSAALNPYALNSNNSNSSKTMFLNVSILLMCTFT